MPTIRGRGKFSGFTLSLRLYNFSMVYRVYLRFSKRSDGDWIVQFSTPTLDRALGPLRVWKSSEVIQDLVGRTLTTMDSEAKQMLELGFLQGNGGIYLNLTATQYARLLVK